MQVAKHKQTSLMYLIWAVFWVRTINKHVAQLGQGGQNMRGKGELQM